MARGSAVAPGRQVGDAGSAEAGAVELVAMALLVAHGAAWIKARPSGFNGGLA